VDRNLNLIFVHFPIPHDPYLSGRPPRGKSLFYSSVGQYFDSLELVDRTLGVLRRELEAAGLWTQSTILVSSDHSHRRSRVIDGKTDPRVPFLLKLAGVSQPVTFAGHVHTVWSKDLLLEILRGKISTQDEVLAWLRQQVSPAARRRAEVRPQAETCPTG
jgi:hypothetical protein